MTDTNDTTALRQGEEGVHSALVLVPRYSRVRGVMLSCDMIQILACDMNASVRLLCCWVSAVSASVSQQHLDQEMPGPSPETHSKRYAVASSKYLKNASAALGSIPQDAMIKKACMTPRGISTFCSLQIIRRSKIIHMQHPPPSLGLTMFTTTAAR
jgi:hypothetical protein